MELPPGKKRIRFQFFFLEHMTWGFLSYGPNRAGPVEKQINFLIIRLLIILVDSWNNKIGSYFNYI